MMTFLGHWSIVSKFVTLTMWYSIVLKEQHFQFMMLDNMNHLFTHKLEFMSAPVLQQKAEKTNIIYTVKIMFHFYIQHFSQTVILITSFAINNCIKI